MARYQEQYKGKRIGFGNVKEGRYLRVEGHEESRKRHRAKAFNENRDILNSPDHTSENKEAQLTSNVKEDRGTRLLRWRAERDKRKKIEQRKQKPAFVVGIMHHKIFSPINKDTIVKEPALHKKVHKVVGSMAFPKGITKATERRLINKSTVKNPTKSLVKASNPPANKRQKEPKKQQQSIAPSNYKFKAPAGLPPLLFGRVAAQSMSPGRMSDLLSFSPMVRRSSRKSNITKFTVEDINNKECDASVNNEKETTSDLKESSIEEVLLRLSSDDDEKLNLSNSSSSSNKDSNSSNESKVDGKDDKTLNNSATKASSQSDNNCSIAQSASPINESVFLSPYIVSSRGKSNARKEQQLRRGLSLGRSSSGEIPTKDSVMRDLNISVEEEERTARYFLFLLNREIERLNELCKKWSEVKDQPETTEDAQYRINQAIGQTNLLVNKKFQRFRGLVFDCETGKGEMLVTCKDLQGFWDMMHMEIKDCDLRFEKLEKLRSIGWEEEEELPRKPIGKKKIMVRKKVVPKKSSSIRSFLAERKRKMAQKLRDADDTEAFQIIENHVPDKLDKNENSPNIKHKTRRSVSVSVNDKKFTPDKYGGTRSSLLRKVQLSEVRIKSPLTIMKVSQMCKTPGIQLNNSVSYVNSDQTPGKSILKQPKNSTEIDSHLQSAYKVNFDNNVRSNEIPVDQETQIKRELAVALARIDGLDFDQLSEEMSVNAGKKLDFDDNSSEESEDVQDMQQNFEVKYSNNKSMINVPTISVQTATPRVDESLVRRTLRRQNAVDENGEEFHGSLNSDTNECNKNIRILRNRSVTLVDTAKSNRRSLRKVSMNVNESEYKENKTPSKTRRKSSVKVGAKNSEQINSKIELERTVDDTNIKSNNGKRRQSARTVKFSVVEKDCSICVEDKPVLPVTPHVRRSKIQFSEKERRSTSKQKQTSLETPEKPLPRIRRSQIRKVQNS